jgi:DNA-binding NtrC family response regulator
MNNRSRASDRLNISVAGSERPRPGSEQNPVPVNSPGNGNAATGVPMGVPMPLTPSFPVDCESQIALRAAQSNCTLLITGETGVGKGHLARWLHEHSPRNAGPFIPVNCGAIPETLIDSQLFGHTRGSFSGATADHLGLVRAAERGTLLLDEISELPATAQNRLLRLLQDHEVQPVGHSRPIIVDVRVMAASNIDLQQAVSARRFREDLLFRLDVIRLNVKPLRERLHELPIMLNAFNAEFAGLYRQPALEFEPAASEALRTYHWPGNVRQLRTLIERLHVLCPNELVTVRHLQDIGHMTLGFSNALPALDRLKFEELRRVLSETGGSIARAAMIFGVHRSTIYRWLRGHSTQR